MAKCSQCAPDHRSPEQIRPYRHHLFVERHRAWSVCNQVAAGLQCFYTSTRGWDTLQLHLPPRPGRSQLPHVLSPEALQRLFLSAQHPKPRALRMTTYAAGLRVSEVVPLQLTDSESDRRLIRVNQGKGNKDRYPLLSPRLLAARRASWTLERPPRWLCPGQDRTQPMPRGTAQRSYYHAKRAAHMPHGQGLQTLRHSCATHLLEAGGDPRTIQRLLGPRSLAPTSRSLQVTRTHLAGIRSPFDLLRLDTLPPTPAE